MCGAATDRTVTLMISKRHTGRISALSTALVLAAAVSPATGQAAGNTQTLSVFSKPVSFTLTSADGTVSHHPPATEPKPGDVLEMDSIDFVGNHRHHAKRATISDHLQCTFGAGPEPDCLSWSAVGGSLLRFRDDRLIGGTGRYQGATGRVVSNREVAGGSDIVVRIRRP
jgi:hypothetical protein